MNRFSKQVLLTAFIAAVCQVAAIGDERDSSATISESPITSEDREHWSFMPLRRPAVPNVAGVTESPIDRFVLAEFPEQIKQFAPPANRRVLARRVTLSLLGLPPTPEQIDSFVNDERPDAYLRFIDSILASPQYGERWAQHWLDLARFAETDGFEHDLVRPNAWKYRDWVIRAYNSDLRYDRFVALQLAGDELEPGDAAASIATTFCLAGPDMPDINSQEERRHSLLNEMTSTVGSVMMGLQLECAQCHDHKYDPLSQADFYRMRAIFEPAVHVKRNKSVDRLKETKKEIASSHLMIRGDWRRKGAKLNAAFPRIANPDNLRINKVKQNGSSGRRSSLARWLTSKKHPLTSRVIVNRVWQHHFGRGICATPSDFGLLGAQPTHLELLDWLAVEFIESGWSIKELHRLILNSEAYRQVSSLDVNATPAEVTEWKLRIELDPIGELLTRGGRKRIEGEVIRDSMLAVSGVLDLQQRGPGVRPPLPPEMVKTLLRNQWKVTSDKRQHYRRSVYIFARRNLRYPIFDAFDRPDANASCPERSASTTAPQSLLLVNSKLSLELARRFASRLERSAPGQPAKQIASAFQLALGRQPSANEASASLEFVREQAAYLTSSGRATKDLAIGNATSASPFSSAALTDFCLALFNLNEFVYVD